jgi:hypothetical protein
MMSMQWTQVTRCQGKRRLSSLHEHIVVTEFSSVSATPVAASVSVHTIATHYQLQPAAQVATALNMMHYKLTQGAIDC